MYSTDTHLEQSDQRVSAAGAGPYDADPFPFFRGLTEASYGRVDGPELGAFCAYNCAN